LQAPLVHRKDFQAMTFLREAVWPLFFFAGTLEFLFCGDKSPAHDGATNCTPSYECFINLSCEFGLVSDRPFGHDLRIRHVPDRNPTRRACSHLVGNEPEYGVSHFGDVAESLKVEVIVGSVEAKQIGRNDGRGKSARRHLDDFGWTRISRRQLSRIRLE